MNVVIIIYESFNWIYNIFAEVIDLEKFLISETFLFSNQYISLENIDRGYFIIPHNI